MADERVLARAESAGLSNLPASMTSFIGRASEIADITRHLADTRLLTLTGSGGIGKSRLALAVAERLRDQFPDGLWVAELAALADATLVTYAIAAAVGLREGGARPILDLLIDRLGGRSALLILDNCEHLLDACACACETLLRACPRLQIMLTSREAVRLTAETIWRVPALSLPQPGVATEDLRESEAVRLFVTRARAVQPEFNVSPANAASVAEICRRLDGIPLAIELAAAWAKTLSPQEIGARLDDRFRLLARGGRTALPRQQTLKGTLDWSYGLLSHGQRTLLRRLSAFEGGWTLAAAESVCATDPLQAEDILGLLAGLVDKSLVLADAGAEPARYRLLETTRQYALELLASDGETELLRSRHADYFRSIAKHAERQLLGPQQLDCMRRLDHELENLRATQRWAVEHAESDLELEMVASLWDYWWMRGLLSEGQRHAEGALATSTLPTSPIRARATHGAGLLAAVQGDLLGRGLQRLAESVALYRALGDATGLVRPLSDLASTMAFIGQLESGDQFASEALTVARAQSDSWAHAYALHSLSQVRLAQHDYADAVRLAEQEVERWRHIGDDRGLAHGLLQLAIALRLQGGAEAALPLAREGLEGFMRLGETWGELGSIIVIAACTADLNDAEGAAGLVGLVDAFSRRIGAAPIPTWQRELDSARRAARAELGDSRFDDIVTHGQHLPLEHALSYPRAAAPVAPGARAAAGMPAELHRLTRRELEVLDLLVQRYSNREIADELVMSVRTVERHISNIYGKTGAANRREAAAVARAYPRSEKYVLSTDAS